MGKSPFRRITIVRKLCDRINKLQNPNDGIDIADEIFTIPIASTQHWVKSITKCAMELCVRRDSAVHPLEFSDLSGTSDLSHLIAQRM